MNSRLAARDVDGGAYCCTGKAHHLARRLRAEPEVGGYACGPPPRVGCRQPFYRPWGASISGLIIMPLQAADRVPPNRTMQSPRSCNEERKLQASSLFN